MKIIHKLVVIYSFILNLILFFYILEEDLDNNKFGLKDFLITK